MSLRLSSYRFYFRVWIYALPLLSFAASAYLRFFSGDFKGLSLVL